MRTASLTTNVRLKMRGTEMLAGVEADTARLAFFDPQYRGIMDHLGFGNEGARQIERAKLPQMQDSTIRLMVDEIERVLKPSGHLMFWVDKFTMVEARWRRWVKGESELKPVDMISWNKGRDGMGRRSRCRTEFLIILQKPPVRAKGIWRDHGISDSWSEYSDRSVHPHAKPLALQTRLIKCCAKPGELVIDPCAGSFGVMDACLATGRTFLGCDVLG